MQNRFIVVLAIFAGSAVAQGPKEITLPKLSGDRLGGGVDPGSGAARNPAIDPVKLYQNRRQAAIAAFQGGHKGATTEGNRMRGVRLFLLALQRDPTLAKALYNLGILCVQMDRWDDAISFYQEVAQSPNAEPDLVKLVNAELERVRVIQTMETSPAGKETRKFEIAFVSMLPKSKADPANAFDVLEKATSKMKGAERRWEVPALAGLLQADLGKFAESNKFLETAAAWAPPTRRPQIAAAAEAARKEANFNEQINGADDLWDKKQWGLAAKQYVTAWENSPGRADVALHAAAGFLLADNVDLAVQILKRMRVAGTPETDSKAVAMLKELGAYSKEAKEFANLPADRSERPPSGAVADRIRSLVGPLTNPQMELAIKPDPPLLDDNTRILPMPDDPELAGGFSDMMLLSTSIFGRYRKSLPGATETPVQGDPSIPVAEPGIPSAPQPLSDIPVTPATPGAQAPDPSRPQPLITPPARPQPLSAAGGTATPGSASPSAPAPNSPIQPTLPSLQRSPAAPPPAPPTTTPSPAPAVPPVNLKPTQKGPLQTANFISVPPGALIVFDNDPASACTMPCQYPLTPGRHAYRATLSGYRDTINMFNLDKGKQPPQITVTLPPKQGTLFVDSSPAGGIVIVNGIKTAKKTPTSILMAEGEYSITVEIDGKVSAPTSLSMIDGKMIRLVF